MSQDNLNIKIARFVELEEQMQEYTRLATEHRKLYTDITAEYKQQGIDRKVVRLPDGRIAILSFKIYEQRRIDTTAVPESIRQKYLKIVKIHRKQLSIIDDVDLVGIQKNPIQKKVVPKKKYTKAQK